MFVEPESELRLRSAERQKKESADALAEEKSYEERKEYSLVEALKKAKAEKAKAENALENAQIKKVEVTRKKNARTIARKSKSR